MALEFDDEARGAGEYDDLDGEHFPIADVVSLGSIVNVLIRKGICTPEELYEEEQKRRDEYRKTQDATIARTERPDAKNGNGVHRHRKSGWLKRKMSKKRWTRRLGTRLFGWEWKKVKHQRTKGESAEPQ